ncbi:hypothetical protein FJZ41_00960 [Candidatus Shapirobacteria bacterium]|nr:hypothetical protein [Candidatus Shapirobacteria bacterium]
MLSDWISKMNSADWGYVGILAIGLLIAIIRDVRRRRRAYKEIMELRAKKKRENNVDSNLKKKAN